MYLKLEQKQAILSHVEKRDQRPKNIFKNLVPKHLFFKSSNFLNVYTVFTMYSVHKTVLLTRHVKNLK
jgi:hypothetical protein